MTYNDIYKTLDTFGQLHLLKNYDTLQDSEKDMLLQQISSIDLNILSALSSKNKQYSQGTFEPIETLTLKEIDKNKDQYYRLGIEAIRQGKVGAVLLAGGQGTRLGFDKPKGTLNVGIAKDLYLFEILIQNLLVTVKQAGSWIPLYIMTSVKNNTDTILFFEEHNYFNYNKDSITFFTQELAPSVDYNGKIYMEDNCTLSLSPNGNGGWFSSLTKAGILDKIKAAGIQWLNVFSVDNVLQKIADPYFIGATIEANCACGAKVVKKAAPEEKVGVLCLEDGKPSVVEYFDITEEMKTSKNEKGELSYNYGVILNYLFQVSELEAIQNSLLPIHIVEKKIPYINTQGQYITPDLPNGYKFETLLLDMIHMLNTCLPYEVERTKEFAPIKNKSGTDSLDSARALLEVNGIQL